MHFFITWHESIESAFDVFILTETKGQRLDLYVGKEGSPCAEQLSHVILFSTMSMVQDLLRRAALCQRKQYLWRVLGEDYSPSSMCVNDVLEMITTSQKLELNTIDEHIKSFFCEESTELQIVWVDLFSQIHLSSPFTHCITFSSNGSTHYVVYVNSQDFFMSFKQNSHTHIFEESFILIRDHTIASTYKKGFTDAAIIDVLKQFINYVSRWMFLSCMQFSVT